MYAYNALLFSDKVRQLPELEVLPYMIIAVTPVSYTHLNILRTADSTSQDRRIPAGRPAMKAVPAIIRFSYKNSPAIVLAESPETIYRDVYKRQYHFSKLYKKQLGESPSKYRQKQI